MRAELIQLLLDETVRQVFLAIVANGRRISLGKLLEVLKDTPRDQTVLLLKELQNHNLIEELSAPLPEWHSYHLTADGLSAERDLSRVSRNP